MRKLRFFGLFVIVVIVSALSPGPAPAQDANPLPLAGRGPYGVGVLTFSVVDDSRDGRVLDGMIWYPAQAGRSSYLVPEYQAAPDTAAAPYPLILYSHYLGGMATTTLTAGPHLASYGFVVVSVEHRDPGIHPHVNLVNRPLDILFVLSQLPTLTESGLAGMVDFERVGVTGYSAGAITALLLGGTRIDPQSFTAYCEVEAHQNDTPCEIYPAVWEEMVALRAGLEPPPLEGEPWPATTGGHIAAVMPVAPCRGPLFGERGLASAAVPILIIGLEDDEFCYYDRDALFIYEHLGSDDRALLTVSGVGHAQGIDDPSAHDIFNHFAVAFFGTHLQGSTGYAQYLTADFVDGFDNLQWASSQP